MDKLRLLIAQQNPIVGDIQGNLTKAAESIKTGQQLGADLVVLSELFLSGYPPEDLVLNPNFIADVGRAAARLAEQAMACACLVGAPWQIEGKLYNAALLLDEGKVAHVFLKRHLPNYDVFDEARLFSSGTNDKTFNFRGLALSVLICEDIWEAPAVAMPDADMTLVLNASPYEQGKMPQRLARSVAQARRNDSALVYVNQVGGQDDLVFDGASFVLSKEGEQVAALPAWQSENRLTEWSRSRGTGGGRSGRGSGGREHSWVCAPQALPAVLSEQEEVYQALVLGLRDYVEKNNFEAVVLGLSGGIDSALVAALACDALGSERVHCFCLPSRFTSPASLTDAAACATALGTALTSIDIEPVVKTSEHVLAPHFLNTSRDLTEENIQSRLRGLLLMALSNKFGWMLLSTGNKSEMSVGYATLYGDMNGGFNPLKDIYKMQVYELARWRNGRGEVIPQSIIDKAPSAELREDQKDEDSLPPYPQLDDILAKLIDKEHPLNEIYTTHDRALVERIAHLVRLAEYKRRQSPPGVRISQRNFGKARRYPITNAYKPATD